MKFLVSLLGGLFGILLAIAIVIFVIYQRIKASVGSSNIKSLVNAMTNPQNLEREEYTREKNVKGMTKLLEEEILRDFPDFNKELIFSICNNNLRKIFNALESKDFSEIEKDDNLVFLRKTIKEQIRDMQSNNIEEKYDNIEFNRNAISSYAKKNGKATIQLSTTLSYYYKTNRKDKTTFADIKKQTRYTSEFVYVYDESEFDDSQVSFSVHCPNCGAPLKNLENDCCEYCSTHIEKINSRVWKMSSYKEDYK